MDLEKLDLFNQLLALQKATSLSTGDEKDLEELGSQYDRINLVKSYAMIEAVKRNLMTLPEPK